MLTIPWFVTKTFQDLFRRAPVPTENEQQRQFQQHVLQRDQLQHHQQQPLPPPPHVRQTQVQQNQAPERQTQVQQNQAPVRQQNVQQQQEQAVVRQPQLQQQQAPVKQPQVPQQEAPVKQQQVQQQQAAVNQQQAPVKQPQVSQQEAPVKQQHVQQQQAPLKQPQVSQQEAPVKQQQVQQQQAPVTQPTIQQQAPVTQPKVQPQQAPANQAQTAHVHNNLSQQNATRVQNVTPPKSPASEVSTDFTQAKTDSRQHTSPGARELHSSATSQLSEATPNVSKGPAVDLSPQTSSKTVVLRNSNTGGRMSFEWAQNQVEKFQFDFDQADTDKSGSLSFQEVYNVLKNVGFKGSKEEAESIFRHLDRDQDKKITREEFKATLSNLPRLSIKEFVLRKAFLKLDKDGSGYLTKSEIIDATKADAGLDIAAEKISDLLLYLIKEDEDEKVSYEEFLHVFGVESAATVLRQVFAKLDTDGSGFLSKEEILEAVRAENELKLKADKISDLLIYWCKDQDKKISYNEFVDVWLQQKKEKPKK